MRKFIIFLLILGGLGWWFSDFVTSGKCERFMDKHPSPNYPVVEYYWGNLLNMADCKGTAEKKYRRVMEKYPKSSYAPLAWVELINMYYEANMVAQVVDESSKFLEAYPDHPKAETIKKKVSVIKYGY